MESSYLLKTDLSGYVLLDFNDKMPPKRKTPIPKKTKNLVWDTWIGENIAKANCLCCERTEIKMSEFECGHVLSEAKGGGIEIDNLRPICRGCNASMRTENMADFKKKCGYGVLITQPPTKRSHEDEFKQMLITTGKLCHSPPFGEAPYYDKCYSCGLYFHNAFDDQDCPFCSI